MAADPGLALPKNLGQLGDVQLTLREQMQQPKTATLADRPQTLQKRIHLPRP
jgi:hypothetical protein